MKSLVVFCIFDNSLSSQAVAFSIFISVSSLLCFCAITDDVITFAPANTANFLNPPPQGDSSNTLSLPVYCLTFGGVYGLNSVCLNALNSDDFISSLIKEC